MVGGEAVSLARPHDVGNDRARRSTCTEPAGVSPGRRSGAHRGARDEHGATRSWWLAALDDRIKATVSVCCTTRYQDLIDSKHLAAHGIYYFVPGMLREKIETEAIHGLIAPRALLTLNGDRDPTSPITGVKTINGWCEQLYRLYGKPEQFRGVIYENTPHSYTHAMWDQTLTWFKEKL